MLYLSKSKLESLLKAKGINIAKLANKCSISRQSIYNMFGDTSVFNTTFEKMLAFLNIKHLDITEEMDHATFIIKTFPDKIKKIVFMLSEFAEQYSADLILFGSRAAGKKGIRYDYDFAVLFHKKAGETRLKVLKQSLVEKAFPNRIDIVCLNSAPAWFVDSIKEDMVYLRKEGKK